MKPDTRTLYVCLCVCSRVRARDLCGTSSPGSLLHWSAQLGPPVSPHNLSRLRTSLPLIRLVPAAKFLPFLPYGLAPPAHVRPQRPPPTFLSHVICPFLSPHSVPPATHYSFLPAAPSPPVSPPLPHFKSGLRQPSTPLDGSGICLPACFFGCLPTLGSAGLLGHTALVAEAHCLIPLG